VASATAATATSQLWIAGTWIAAAVTPVLVTLISELLNRPTEKIARAWTSDRPAVAEPPPLPEAGGAAPPRSSRPPASPPARDLPPVAGTADAPVRIYRQPSGRAPRRKIALRAVLVMGGLAFVIAVVTLTAGELIAGDSIGQGDRRTTFVGGSRGSSEDDNNEPAEDRRARTTEEERSPQERQETAPQEEPTPPQATETTPAPRAVPPSTTPTETAPAP
jgi:hypothetical protein